MSDWVTTGNSPPPPRVLQFTCNICAFFCLFVEWLGSETIQTKDIIIASRKKNGDEKWLWTFFKKAENWRDACLKITNKPAPSLSFLSAIFGCVTSFWTVASIFVTVLQSMWCLLVYLKLTKQKKTKKQKSIAGWIFTDDWETPESLSISLSAKRVD